jgi:hypothetical protein
LVVAASGLIVGSQASATHPEASLGVSNFEIDLDANLKVDDGGSLDWANVNDIRGIDKPTGQTDDSYVGGTKEDTSCPSETTGSIPNNKSDLLTLQAYQEAASAGNSGFFNFAWSRVSDPSGTTLMDFEFNQGTTACVGSPNIQRTIGDKLVEYSIDQGGARANITIRNWSGTAWGPATVLTDPSSLCPVAGQPAPCAAGTINSSSIPFGDSDGLISSGSKSPRTFGEAQIDLRLFGGGGANPCVNFGYLTVKSRSSDSFTSQLKDFIRPTPIGLGNCAKVIIRKVTDPAGSTQSFPFTSTAVTSPATSGSFSLTGATPNNVKTIVNVVPGNGYTITEGANPAGWDFVSLDCSASTGVTVAVNGKVGTYSIDAATDIVDCTYTNRQRGTIKVDKVTDPTGSTQVFNFTSNYGAGFSLTDASTPNDSGLLVPGTYNVAETPVTGWTLTSATCSDGSPVTAIDLGAGETVTCTFNNQARGHIIVTKQTDPDGSSQVFDFTTTGTGYAGFSLTDGNSNDSGALAPGAYSVAEQTPDGWEQSSAVCDDDDSADPAHLTLDAGETIHCLFTNEANASITVWKNVIGFDPGQSFSFASNFGVPSLTNGGSFDSSSVGDLDPGTYNVTENGLSNWLLLNADPNPGTTGAGGNVQCSDGSNSGAIGLTAGEHVMCTFDNEWQVGAIRITKDAKHADAPGGVIPLAVGFNIHDNVTNADIPVATDATGSVCVDNFAFGTDRYTISEITPAGYAAQPNQTVSINAVSRCNRAPVVAAFHNVPLTNVSIVVDSQVDGATSTVIDCGAAGSKTVSDGSLDFTDLLPTDPAVTLTCTITIDP